MNLTLLGTGFDADPTDNLTCHFRGGQNYASHGVPVDATGLFISNNAVVCQFPPSGVLPLDSPLDLKLNANESWSQNSHAVVSVRTFAEVALDKRPYLSNETEQAVILVRVDADAIQNFPGTKGMTQIDVCRTIRYSKSNHTEMCDSWDIQPNGTAIAVPIKLGDLSYVKSTDLEIDITFFCTGNTSQCNRGDHFRLGT